MRANASMREIVYCQVSELSKLIGQDVKLVLAEDMPDDSLEWIAVWLDSWLEGKRVDDPPFISVITRYGGREVLVITDGTMLGRWLLDDSSQGNVFQQDFYGDPADISHWNDLRSATGSAASDPDLWAESFFVHPSLSYGDYDGSTAVERSNVAVFMERYGDTDGVYDIAGGHGSSSVAIRLTTLDQDDMFDTLAALNDYPLIDEEHHSLKEQEMLNEEWANSGRREFVEALEGNLDIDIADQNFDRLDNLYFELSGQLPEYDYIEGGGNAVFHIDDTVEEIAIEDLDGVVTYTVEDEEDD